MPLSSAAAWVIRFSVQKRIREREIRENEHTKISLTSLTTLTDVVRGVGGVDYYLKLLFAAVRMSIAQLNVCVARLPWLSA